MWRGGICPCRRELRGAPRRQRAAHARAAGVRGIDDGALAWGGVQGNGSVYVISHNSNASVAGMNEALAAGAQAGFAGKEAATPEGAETGAIVLSGIDRDRVAEIARKHSLN